MFTQLERTLSSVSASRWKPKRVILLDWFDGPMQGFCELDYPACVFYFRVIASRSIRGNVDDRLFTLYEGDELLMGRVLALMENVGSNEKPIWKPRWLLGRDAVLESCHQEMAQQLEDELTRVMETGIIIRTRDMKSFTGVWFPMR